MLYFKFHIFIFNSLVTSVLMESRMKTDKSSKIIVTTEIYKKT
jgi:hypothetical protein